MCLDFCKGCTRTVPGLDITPHTRTLSQNAACMSYLREPILGLFQRSRPGEDEVARLLERLAVELKLGHCQNVDQAIGAGLDETDSWRDFPVRSKVHIPLLWRLRTERGRHGRAHD